MKRGLKGFAFLVSGLVLGSLMAFPGSMFGALSAMGMAKVRRASKPEVFNPQVPWALWPAQW